MNLGIKTFFCLVIFLSYLLYGICVFLWAGKEITKSEVKYGPKKGHRGYVDSQGRIWLKDYAHAGKPDHWDGQLDGGKGKIDVSADGGLIKGGIDRMKTAKKTPDAGAGAATTGLVASGVSGDWRIDIDESLTGPQRWFVQIEGPVCYLNFEVSQPRAITDMTQFLRGSRCDGQAPANQPE